MRSASASSVYDTRVYELSLSWSPFHPSDKRYAREYLNNELIPEKCEYFSYGIFKWARGILEKSLQNEEIRSRAIERAADKTISEEKSQRSRVLFAFCVYQ